MRIRYASCKDAKQMAVEYYSYYPVVKRLGKPCSSPADIRQELPREIEEQLIHRTGFEHRLCVETCKKEVIAYLDKRTQVRKNCFKRCLTVEVEVAEIDQYQFYAICLRSLDWGKQIQYDVTRPKCTHETCPVGSIRTSPVTIDSPSNASPKLARISGIWDMGVSFVVSESLKNIFDSDGISGLVYEQCLTTTGQKTKRETKGLDDRYFYARISKGHYEEAEEIYLHDWCKTHKVIVHYDIVGVRTPRKATLNCDFQMVSKVNVKGREYCYRLPHWFVSKRVVNILLEDCPHDLRIMAPYLKERFSPVLLTE